MLYKLNDSDFHQCCHKFESVFYNAAIDPRDNKANVSLGFIPVRKQMFILFESKYKANSNLKIYMLDPLRDAY